MTTKHILALSLVFGSLIISGCSPERLKANPLSQDPDPWMVEIDPAHQTCTLDTDCGLVYVDCSTCDCGVPIHMMYIEHYTDRYHELCLNYVGPVCEIECPPETLICLSGQCARNP